MNSNMTDFKRVTLYKIKTVSGFEDFIIGSNYDSVDVEDGVTGLIKYEEVLSKNKNEDDIPWLVFLNSGHPLRGDNQGETQRQSG
ncbi:hypothetical protein [Pseudomonas putida]|uniref:hypothetical protein n=1 Tax=Pseudomonas putida TaxID=303 RepID=UPI0011AF8131|nr:hypothetical protein [Pseudomonas putida]